MDIEPFVYYSPFVVFPRVAAANDNAIVVHVSDF